MQKILFIVLSIFSFSFTAHAGSLDAAKIIEGLSGQWRAVKWVNFENMNKTFTADEQNDIQFDSLKCTSSELTITADSFYFDRDKACYFMSCSQPFSAYNVKRLLVVNTGDIHQKTPGIELATERISKYLLRLMDQDLNSQPLMIYTACPVADKERKLQIIYINDRIIGLYNGTDIIVLKKK